MPYKTPLKPIDFDLIRSWYFNLAVKYEIIKFLKNRELALLVAPYVNNEEIRKRSTRMLRCHSVQHMDFIFKALEVYNRETPYNLYYSIARYKRGIPMQTMNMIERKERNRRWIKIHHREMQAYDFFLDIDAPDFNDMDLAHYSAKIMMNLFNKMNTPYELRFSGKGFHFIIPFEVFPIEFNFKPFAYDSVYFFFAKIAKALHDQHTEMIDTSIYDSRRVCKVPYSLSLYKNDVFVCYPLNTKKEFRDWTLENSRPDKLPFQIRGRDSRLFNENGNIYKLLKELNITWE